MNDEFLPEPLRQAAQERIDDHWYRSLVIGVVDGGESEVFAFGELDDGKKPDGDTVYEIGSITKTFTATLLAADVLSGRCTLDTPVVEVLTGFKIAERNGKKITLGQLATHHSGLPCMPSNILSEGSTDPYADYDAEKMKAFLKDRQPSRDPGESFEYSNLAYGLLGHALAESANTTYGPLLDRKIFQPLGMTMSAPELTERMRQRLAIGRDEKGNPVEHFDFKALAGAGGICSTANDMLRYLRANMGVDQTPLTEAMRLAQRAIINTDKETSIGLAWFSTKTGVIWHNGGTAGHRSFLGFNADRNSGVIVLSDSCVSVDDLGLVVLREDARLAPVLKQVPLSSVSFEEYQGKYRLGDDFVIMVILCDEQFYVQRSGQSALQILPSGRDEFFVKRTCISINFTRDETGTVNGLILHQNGDHCARKLSAPEVLAEQESGNR